MSREGSQTDNIQHSIAVFSRSKRPIRKYHAWPGNISFHLRGHLQLGYGRCTCLIGLILTILPFILFLSFALPLLQESARSGMYVFCSILLAIILMLMFLTSCTDPGIIDRYTTTYDEYLEMISKIPADQPRSSWPRFCETCMTARSARGPFLGVCIGKRNYLYFYVYLICVNASSVTLIIIAGFCFVNAGLKYINEQGTINPEYLLEYMIRTIVCGFVMIYSFAALCVLLPLFIFHTLLIARNKTSREQSLNIHGSVNPFNMGCFHNCGQFMCQSRRESVNFLEKLTVDHPLLMLEEKGRQIAKV
ncbi:MAG: hypothetical protein EZS28_007571 [Streblomastix strix]|uniref:Palmitoyltransferase n=1 Tax=Streblomastix strix TaxID=222440 RepID=A0A5J4WS39_9EUKA|nr:MAG: hypothetical protein EZS28_007564 [Streblomastix strix]KAA6396909.1 MAG: hypothetical protein EZS28_007571 [Streblomastix strix]